MKTYFSARWLGLIVGLLIELWIVTYQVRLGRLADQVDSPWLSIAQILPAAAQVLVVALAAALVFGWRGFAEEVRRAESANPNRWKWRFLGANLVCLGGYLGLTAWFLADDPPSSVWIVPWGLLAVGAFVCLGLTALPAETWLRWMRRCWIACLSGVGVGLLAHLGGQLTMEWWRPLSASTFWLVEVLLRAVAFDVTSDPERFSIGIVNYRVHIGVQCSGYEGIGLIWVFLAAYLWMCRDSLRFPHAFFLVPIGTGLIWLTNGIRITALIAIGAYWSPDIAERGFHSQAGWLAFCSVGLGLVAAGLNLDFFSRRGMESATNQAANPASPYLVPFLVLMAGLMLGSAFSAGFDYLYPFRMLAVAVALGWYWRENATWSWSWSWSAAGIGVAVFVIWVGLEVTLREFPDESAFVAAVEAMPGVSRTAWVFFRVLGSVVAVPFAEELAFRGFLMRRLQANDFTTIPQGRFTWLSFLLSSVLFGFLHDRWIAGIIAGMLYAAAVYRRGELSDAVLAHAITNALIAGYVLTTGTWFLWI